MTQAEASKRAARSTLPAANAPTAGKSGAPAGPKKGAGRARRPSTGRSRAKIGPREAWGEAIRADLTKEGDPPAITMLIRQAARCATRLEALDRVLHGDAAGWLRLEAAAIVPREGKVPARLTVELKIDDAVREERQQAKLLAALFADIHRQRAAMPPAPPTNGGGGRGRSLMSLEDLDED